MPIFTGSVMWSTAKPTLSLGSLACLQKKSRWLFKAFCTPLYTTHLSANYKRASMKKLQVAYNDPLGVLQKKPRWTSASELFVFCSALKRILKNIWLQKDRHFFIFQSKGGDRFERFLHSKCVSYVIYTNQRLKINGINHFHTIFIQINPLVGETEICWWVRSTQTGLCVNRLYLDTS